VKGINLKKIGAIVAGSAILASSVAFAGLMYNNVELVNNDGQPLAKVVVGENGWSSDGVAGAWIASKLANEAYKSATLTAEVVGEGTCNGEGGAGTCEVVEGSETVTLEITVPGSGALGRYDFKSAIGDYIDRELENRYESETDADEAYTIRDDYDDDEANIFQDHIGGYVDTDFDDITWKAVHQANGGNFAPFADVEVQDTKSGDKWTEQQFFVTNAWNNWDPSDNELELNIQSGAYVIIFDPNGDYGIPICPGDSGLGLSGVNTMACDDTDTIPAHKVFVRFLNEDWVVSEVEPATGAAGTSADTEVFHTDGSIIKLAKEAVSGIINVGEMLDTGTGYKVRLDDISREVGAGNAHPAIITVLDANDNEVCQDQVWPGQTKDDLCDTPTGVKLHVYQTAPGLNFIAKWAELAIYSDEIELKDGKEFIEDSDSEWDVLIGWSNEGTNMAKSDPMYWRALYLYTDSSDYDEMVAGDQFPVVDLPDYEKFDLLYNGVDDEGVDYDTLKYKHITSKRIGVRNSTSDADDKCYINISPNEAYEVTVSDGEFRGTPTFPAAAGTRRGGTLYWLFDGAVDDTCGTGDPPTGSAILEDKDGDYWLYEGAGGILEFDYRWAGSNGYFLVYDTPVSWTGLPETWLVEDAGKWKEAGGTTNTVVDALGTAVDTGADNELRDACTAAEKDEVCLAIVGESDAPDPVNPIGATFGDGNLGYEDMTSYEAYFLSLRGTQFKSGSDRSREFRVPKSLLKASYTFATAETAEAEPDTNTYTLHEGEEAVVGTTGVKVLVKSIDQQLTPCTVGAAAGAGTCDMSSVSAVIMPDNTPTVETSVPYKLTSNLVMLDRDATGLDTGVVITVGGDQVNTVTAEAIAGSDVDFEATPVVVKAIGNKIVVAGMYADDTLTAANQFVSSLKRS